MAFHVPDEADTQLISESFGGDEFCGAVTATSFDYEDDLAYVYVPVEVRASRKLPVDVEFGSPTGTVVCSGFTNSEVICGAEDEY